MVGFWKSFEPTPTKQEPEATSGLEDDLEYFGDEPADDNPPADVTPPRSMYSSVDSETETVFAIGSP